MYIFIDPKGNTYRVKQWTVFCRKHKLNKRNIHRVIKNELIQNKGWIAYKLSEERIWKKRNQKMREDSKCKRHYYSNPFYAISPQGFIHQFDSQKLFMQTFTMFTHRQHINRVLSGERPHAKGWNFIRKSNISYNEIVKLAEEKKLKFFSKLK